MAWLCHIENCTYEKKSISIKYASFTATTREKDRMIWRGRERGGRKRERGGMREGM